MHLDLAASGRRNASSPEAAFDYSMLPASIQKEVRDEADTIRRLLAKTSANVIQLGLRLQFVRSRLGRQRFQPWLKAEFCWSQAVASNCMRAARAFSELECLGRFQPSALFVLARENCPSAARAEAIRLAERGEQITKARAVSLVERHGSSSPKERPTALQLRRYVLKTLRKLSPEEAADLAKELLRLLRQMKSQARER